MAPVAQKRTVGILALQGAFAEHELLFKALPKELLEQIEVVQVRTGAQLAACDALVIPGGESTTMKIVAGDNGACAGFDQDLKNFVLGGVGRKPRPVWGTCAGCILLSEHTVDERPGVVTMAKKPRYGEQVGGLDIHTCRNYFGRQVASFEAPLLASDAEDSASEAFGNFPAVFIRAPAVLKVGEGVRVLARVRHPNADEESVIVAAEANGMMVTAFHPELTGDSRIHRYFIERHVLTAA